LDCRWPSTKWWTRPRRAGPVTTFRSWPNSTGSRRAKRRPAAGVVGRSGSPHGGLDNHAVGGKDSPVSDSPVSDSGHARHAPGTAVWHRGRSVNDRGDTVCVTGAGASGLLAIKNLVEHG